LESRQSRHDIRQTVVRILVLVAGLGFHPRWDLSARLEALQ
jgi:hypothetical protein